MTTDKNPSCGPMPPYAFVFPGTCASPGMGADLAESWPEAADLYERADTVLGRPLSVLMRRGPAGELRRPENAMPATFLCSYAAFSVLRRRLPPPAALLGRSLGDITAAAAAGSLGFEAALRLAAEKGRIFSGGAVPGGAMAALIGRGEQEVLAFCREASAAGTCELAGRNSQDNFIISGGAAPVRRACALAAESGALVIPLPMPGPYHSSLMREAAALFARLLEREEFGEPELPLVSEQAGGRASGGAEARAMLAGATASPVDWVRRVEIARGLGARLFLEAGPDQGMGAIAAKLGEGLSGGNAGTAAAISGLLSRAGA